MARPKKYKIKLTDDELKEFKSVIRKNKTSKTIRCRCQKYLTKYQYVSTLDHIDKTKNACVLIDASSYVLSFDTRMKNFIGTVKPENLRLIEKIQNEQ